MTREEVIRQLQSLRDHCQSMMRDKDEDGIWVQDIEALDLALTALRPVSREQVERMRGEFGKCSMPENMALDAGGAHEFRISGDAIYYCDSEYGWEGEKISYCPWCGKPLTDEAVDMTLERWKEALGDET